MSLFDSLKSKTSQSVSKALSNTEKALKKAELNRQITKSNEELEALCLQFGQMVYHAGVAAEAEVRHFLESAQAIESTVVDYQEKIKELDEVPEHEHEGLATKSLCAQCGADILPTQKFCANCGAMLQSDLQPE